MLVDSDDMVVIIEKLKALLLAVTLHLQEHGRFDELISLFSLVSEVKFDVGHIASQLFWDAVKFHQNKNIYAMQFTQEVNEFWSVGLQLFHAKLLCTFADVLIVMILQFMAMK